MRGAHQLPDPRVLYPEVVIGFIYALDSQSAVRIRIGGCPTGLNFFDFFSGEILPSAILRGSLHGHIRGEIPDTL